MKNRTLFLAILLAATTLLSCKKDTEKEEEKVTVLHCLPTNLSNNVLAFYSFSEGLLDDISGNNHDLINNTTATPASDRNGKDSCAYEFHKGPTSGEFLTTSATSFLNNLNEFSVSLWYQPKDNSRGAGDFESLIRREPVGSDPYKRGQLSIGLHDCRRAVFTRTNSVWDNMITNPGCEEEIIARTNNWAHLVATFRKSGIEMAIYRNGVLQESSTGDGDYGAGVVVTAQDNIGDLFLGKGYTGKIDDVIIFDKTLSPAEVKTIYHLETCCEGKNAR